MKDSENQVSGEGTQSAAARSNYDEAFCGYTCCLLKVNHPGNDAIELSGEQNLFLVQKRSSSLGLGKCVNHQSEGPY